MSSVILTLSDVWQTEDSGEYKKDGKTQRRLSRGDYLQRCRYSCRWHVQIPPDAYNYSDGEEEDEADPDTRRSGKFLWFFMFFTREFSKFL